MNLTVATARTAHRRNRARRIALRRSLLDELHPRQSERLDGRQSATASDEQRARGSAGATPTSLLHPCKAAVTARLSPSMQPGDGPRPLPYSSNSAARRPSARVPTDCSIRREAAVSTCGPARRPNRAVSRSARSGRERRRAERPARGCAGVVLVRARFPSRAARHADVSSTSACSVRSVAGP
jgi:hypothetical protein